jgi:hypothetical protein
MQHDTELSASLLGNENLEKDKTVADQSMALIDTEPGNN